MDTACVLSLRSTPVADITVQETFNSPLRVSSFELNLWHPYEPPPLSPFTE
ncbi:hypothetical protein Hanom_Chr01g00085141 [Helianthus anomalus]